MNDVRQGWLVAMREMRERARSRAFRASVIFMMLIVVALIVVTAALSGGTTTKDAGFAGSTPSELPSEIQKQSDAVGAKTRLHTYTTLAAGETAVRQGKITVLVVDGRRLEWRHRADDQLKAIVTSAVQIVAVRARAASAGISPDQALALVAPVDVTSVEIGQVAGRSPGDQSAAIVMTIFLFYAITTYGAMVMTGVVEEKSSRVVEVLLARVPARNLLAGKIVGIGLLGLAQLTAIAGAALIAAMTVKKFDVPAVRGVVLVWLIVWFVLGYAIFATAFGALGSLASRAEDAQSTAAPIIVVLIVSYFVSLTAAGTPDALWSKVVSYIPPIAPLAMPNRVAMGTAAWWEPLLALAITVATIAALVQLGGRIYRGAVLHTGPALKLRDVWRGTRERYVPVAAAASRGRAAAK